MFWLEWRERKSSFSSLSLWWDVGKCQIRHFSQQYSAYSTTESRRPMGRLENSIREAEEQLIECNTVGQQQNLQRLRRDLGLSLQE